MRNEQPRRLLLATAALACALAARPAAAQDDFGGAPDPLKVIGHEQCARCHEQEIGVWAATPHARTFDRLHRSDDAKAIARRLGLRSVKRNDACVRCHYTRQEQNARLRVIAGVSCESCHGGARDWVDLHANYGGRGATRQNESAEHRDERRAKSIAAGMNNPSNLYLIARQCLACHATPSEEIVNTGGHPPGSDAFDLVAWSQGALRHNFQRGLDDPASPGGNAPSKLPRVRVMHLVGLLADLEASLRAASRATSGEAYGRSAATRAARAKRRLWEAQRKIDHPIVGEALEAVADLRLTLGNSAAIADAADRVGQIAYRLADEEDGAALAALDPLLPPVESYK